MLLRLMDQNKVVKMYIYKLDIEYIYNTGTLSENI